MHLTLEIPNNIHYETFRNIYYALIFRYVCQCFSITLVGNLNIL